MTDAQKKAAAAVTALAVAAVATFELKDDCFKFTALQNGAYVSVVECVPRGSRPKPTDMTMVGKPESAPWQPKNHEDVAFEHACSTGTDCEQLVPPSPVFGIVGGWRKAPLGNTLEPGRWRGAGCFRKAGVELASKTLTSWPPECPER